MNNEKESKMDALAELLGIPENVRDDLKRLSIIQARINTCLSMNKAISPTDIAKYNALCYEHFPMFQDGSEFEKEKPKEGPKAVGVVQIKTKDLEDAGKMPEDVIAGLSPSDAHALEIVDDYIMEHLDKSDGPVLFTTYIVWKCKVLQNWKYLISSTLSDGMYYELTYNGDKGEWYLDAYKKFENRVVR